MREHRYLIILAVLCVALLLALWLFSISFFPIQPN